MQVINVEVHAVCYIYFSDGLLTDVTILKFGDTDNGHGASEAMNACLPHNPHIVPAMLCGDPSSAEASTELSRCCTLQMIE